MIYIEVVVVQYKCSNSIACMKYSSSTSIYAARLTVLDVIEAPSIYNT